MGGSGVKHPHDEGVESEPTGTGASGVRQRSLSRVSSPRIQPAPESGPSSTVPARRARARVLLVDANVTVLATATRALSSLGFAVTACHDPSEALSLHRNHPGTFDAVVVSSIVLRRAPESTRAALIRLDRPLVVTAHEDGEHEETTNGATRVLSGPHTLAELAATIDDALADFRA